LATVLITGCNRGIGLQLIGLQLASQLHERGDTVIGVCRTASEELSALGIRMVTGIDVSESESVAALTTALDGESIDVLINNAGILLRDEFGALRLDHCASLRHSAIISAKVRRSLSFPVEWDPLVTTAPGITTATEHQKRQLIRSAPT